MKETENRKTVEKINEPKSWFSEKFDKMDKPLSGLIREKREKIQVANIKNEREITSHPLGRLLLIGR